jgi:mRNA degradation ribonuclease J1/J2
MHASGHMNKEQLVQMVNQIQPKKLFPVHTENPQLFKSYCSNAQIVGKNKVYKV